MDLKENLELKELAHFLKLQVKGPRVAGDVHPYGTIVTDDDNDLINCMLVSSTTEPDLDAIRESASEVPRHEAIRTALILPDDTTPAIKRQLLRDGANIFSHVTTFTSYLDSHVRAEQVCAGLLKAGEDAPNRSAGLLYEGDFIPPSAIRQTGESVDATSHLVQNWSRGSSPRLCVVLAPAGFGKSKLTHILAKRLAKIYAERAVHLPPVPYLIPFGQYRRTTSFEGLILEAQGKYGRPLLTPDAFRYLVARGRALFILDGYDEMLEQYPGTARSNIADFVSKAGPASRVILTARTLFYRSSGDVVGVIGDPNLTTDDVELLELKPFDRNQAKKYIRIKLDVSGDRSRKVERAQDMIDRDFGGFGIYGSPFFLSEFIELVRNDGFSLTDMRDGGFLDYLVKKSFSRERERQGHSFSDAEQLNFLENIALDMLRTGSAAYDSDDLEVFALEAVGDGLKGFESDDERKLRLLLSHHFLEEQEGFATFEHQVWRDYFQGRALAHALMVRPEEAILVLNRRDLPDGVARTSVSALGGSLRGPVLEGIAGRMNDVGLRNLLRLLVEAGRDEPERTRLPASVSGRLSGRSLVDLSIHNMDLRGANLSGCSFMGTYFTGSDLRDVNWAGAFFSGTSFSACEVDAGMARAENASCVLEGVEFFGPQLEAALEGTPDGDETSDQSENVEKYATLVIAGRLAKFIRGSGIVPSISWSAFMGGVPRGEYDFVVKRLVRALKAEGIILEDRSVSGSRPPFLLSSDPEVRREVLDLGLENLVGPRIRSVMDRVLKRRA